MSKSLNDFKSLIEFTLLASIAICFFVAVGCTTASIIHNKTEKKPSSLYEYWTDDRII
jgi:hypothetical protein